MYLSYLSAAEDRKRISKLLTFCMRPLKVHVVSADYFLYALSSAVYPTSTYLRNLGKQINFFSTHDLPLKQQHNHHPAGPKPIPSV